MILRILDVCIEGIPFIIRFKTSKSMKTAEHISKQGIEGIPFIIRFKTLQRYLQW